MGRKVRGEPTPEPDRWTIHQGGVDCQPGAYASYTRDVRTSAPASRPGGTGPAHLGPRGRPLGGAVSTVVPSGVPRHDPAPARTEIRRDLRLGQRVSRLRRSMRADLWSSPYTFRAGDLRRSAPALSGCGTRLGPWRRSSRTLDRTPAPAQDGPGSAGGRADDARLRPHEAGRPRGPGQASRGSGGPARSQPTPRLPSGGGANRSSYAHVSIPCGCATSA